MEKDPTSYDSNPETLGELSQPEKTLEYNPELITRVNSFLEGIDSQTSKSLDSLDDVEKFNMLLGLSQELYRFYNKNSDSFELNSETIEAANLIAKARILQVENELSEEKIGHDVSEEQLGVSVTGAIGHYLSHSFDGVKWLLNRKITSEQVPDPIKKVGEFTARFYERIGSFSQAYEFYGYSYPDKYKELIQACESSGFNRQVMETHMHADPDFKLKIGELRDEFLALYHSFETDPFMQSDIMDDLKILGRKFLNLVDSNKD